MRRVISPAPMYLYDDIDQRMVDERVAQFRDQTRRFLDGQLAEDDFRQLRLRNGLYVQRYAPMLRIAIPYGLLSFKTIKKTGRHRAQLRPRLRPLLHAPEPAAQLAEAGGRARDPRRARHGADARHPDLGQLRAQHHHRPFRRRGEGRDRRFLRLVRADPAVVDLPPGVQLPAAQVQDRGQRRGRRPRGHLRSRYRPSRSQKSKAKSASGSSSAAASGARRSSAR